MLATYVNLAKPRILILLVFMAIASAIIAGQGSIPLATIAWVTVAAALSSAGSAFLNNYFDRAIDSVMSRTKNRPLPTGKIRPRKVFLIGLGLVVAGLLATLQLNYLVTLFVLLGSSVYIILYTLWLKKRTFLNIVIGGLAGSCMVLVGWFAVDTQLTTTPLLMALLLFLWTPAHFWSFAIVYQDSYRAAAIPMLPVRFGEARTADYILLHAALLFVVSVLLYFTGNMGKIYLWGALLFSSAFLLSSVQLWRHPQRSIAWRNYKISGIYLLGLFLVMLSDVTFL